MNKVFTDILQRPIIFNRNELSFAAAEPDAVACWVSSLSLLPLGDAAKALFEALIEINELECSETLRFDFLQILSPQFNHVLQHLESHFFNQGLIHSDRNDHIIELAFRLRTCLANGYIIIAKQSSAQLTQQKFSLFALNKKKNLKAAKTLSIYYAMHELTQLVYQQQMMYSKPATGQWLCIHWLFDLAQKGKVELENINQLQGLNRPLKNILRSYHQVILLHILNTNQIRQSEIQSLYECSFEWANLIQLEYKESQSSKYVIDKTKDLPPAYNRKQYPAIFPNLFISTQPLLEHITATLHKSDDYLSTIEKQFLTPALKFHVQNILGSIGERRHERFESSGQLHICFGLHTAHFYLSKSKNFIDTIEHDIVLNETTDHFSIENIDKTLFSPPSRLSREAKKIYMTDILDMSVSGYRIKWPEEIPAHLKTGELILVKENIHGKWRGGVIRWIKQASEKNLEMGLEILTKDILPCAVRLENQDQSHYLPALLVQSQHLDHAKLTLIIANYSVFQQQNTLKLQIGTEEFVLYLLKAQLITQSFIQFEFDLPDEAQKNTLKNVMIRHSRVN